MIQVKGHDRHPERQLSSPSGNPDSLRSTEPRAPGVKRAQSLTVSR